MGGPGCSIPLRHPASDEQLYALRQWLWTLDDDKTPPGADSAAWAWHLIGTDSYWSFGLRAGFDRDSADFRPFSLGLVTTKTETEIAAITDVTSALGQFISGAAVQQALMEERQQWMVQLGYYPAQQLALEAHANSVIDHRMLSRIALGLAERCDGLIDLSGALTPRTHEPPLAADASVAERDAHLDRILHPPLEVVHEYVQQLPGHVYEFYYTLASGRRWVWHVMDLDAFRAWMQHPDFHMIK